ncbi:hypothetical protein [Vibrio agarivorans]|uniref:hypothetical protein n=1 Tax=Vibrio agarivorans TaxID=153622 RepID=UPI0025B4BA6E|nr:hypothetical protein [Vibrio agarivorans]MDN3661074.1 hypothetical protein [Vibrio agarivorans]
MFGLPTFSQVTNMLADGIQNNAFSHCNLMCISQHNPNVIINSDGSVFTAIEILGTHRYLTNQTEVNFIAEIEGNTQSILREPHHTIGLMYVRDPSRTQDQLDYCFQPTIETIERLGIDARHFFESQKRDLLDNTAFERTLLILKTKKQAVESLHYEQPELAGEKIVVESIPAVAQNTMMDALELIQQHNAFVKVMVQALSNYLALNEIDGETYLKYCKEEESQTPLNHYWKPKSLSDEEDLTVNNTESTLISHPPLAYQIITDDKTRVKNTGGVIDAGNYFVTTIDREYFHISNDYSTFNEFLRALDRRVPFRAYYELETGTKQIMTELGIRQGWLLWIMFTGYARNIHSAASNLVMEADKNNRTLLKGTLSIATWGETIEKVQQQKRDINQALMSWRSLTPRSPNDTFAGYYATLPAFSKKQSSRPCIQIADKHIATLPITRAATPIDQGALCLSSLDGKPFPIDPTTAKQDYQANMIAGGMSSGKTVFSSVYNNGIMFAKGNIALPPLAYIDFGSGVHNYLNSLKAWLPESQLHTIVCISLINKLGNAVNILEPQFGLNVLEETEMGFASSLLSRMINGTSPTPANGQVSNAVYKIINEFFEYFRANPLRYDSRLGEYVNEEQRLHLEINQLIETGKIVVADNEVLSWYTIRDKLFAFDKTTYFKHARFCHRQGSPDLRDLLRLMQQSDRMRKDLHTFRLDSAPTVFLFDHIIATLESITSRFKNVLGKKSQLDVSQARVVGVDLKGVAGDGEDPDTRFIKQIFGMIANQLATRNFWRDPNTFLKLVPEIYRYHYQTILDEEADLPKHRYMDEYRQMKSDEMDDVLSQQVLIARKYSLISTLSSQQLDHAPNDFIKLATNIYMLTLTDSDAQVLQERYSLSDSFVAEMKRKVRSEDGFGRIILYIGKYRGISGYLVQLLRNQITASYLWNFASDKVDEQIKLLSRKRYGEKTAFLRLAKQFPHGTAKGEIERRLSFTQFDEKPLTQRDVVNEIVDSLANVAI